MKERLLDLLACPTCGGDILLAYAGKYEEKEIMDGVLTCKKCTREYKVIRGVPRFADLEKIEEEKAETAENFGWQWTHFTQEDPKYNEQFLGWLQPVEPDFFAGKVPSHKARCRMGCEECCRYRSWRWCRICVCSHARPS